MKCPRCQSSKVDASGICLTCGYEVSQWKKKLEQRLHAIRQKEEEIEQNLQSIIDAAVSRQPEYSSSPESGDTPSTPQLEELTFLEPDNDEPVVDLFVAIDDDTHDVSDAVNAEYAADSGHIVNAADISDVEVVVYDENRDDDENIPEAEDIADEEDNAYIDDIPDDDIANDDDVAHIDHDDIPDDDVIPDENIADDDDVTDDDDISVNAVDDGRSDDSDTMNIVYHDASGYFPRAVDIQTVSDNGVMPEDDNDTADSLYLLNAPIPEGRLIFLSRTLSGLIDLFLIALFTVVFFGAADYFTNAPMLNSINAISFSTLFLMVYFLYSIFLLGTNGQTIGMIMTDLRVVGMNNKPILLSQVVRRNITFLVSLFGLGIGLLTGVISSECLCLHDRLSETRVIRYM